MGGVDVDVDGNEKEMENEEEKEEEMQNKGGPKVSLCITPFLRFGFVVFALSSHPVPSKTQTESSFSSPHTSLRV